MTSKAVLRTEALTRHFGGLVANCDVTIEIHRGLLHAMLGPNGAGKSTMINLLSGDMAPSGGRIFYKGRDISALPADRRSRLGIGRSYQRTNIFPAFTVFENCRLAAQSRRPHATRIFSNALAYTPVRESAERAMELAGLGHRAARDAGTLSHGEQRQLEIAMVLATDPQVLLLDEPLAGMGGEESSRMVELLRRIAPEHAILLVEHDMDAVFEVAQVVTVMVEGRVLESGPPARIRSSPAVQAAYLGGDGGSHG
ncbi:MAG: ABC transporter ATP-binding protein [Burkholderiaceae bacterium]|nr:ABC transporter ATP-binding protein [Burkholderiaceae bacterium]